MPTGSPSLYRPILVLLITGSLAIGLMILLGSGSDAIEASAPTPQVLCEATDLVYGDAVTCTGQGGVALIWPDGTRTDVEGAHTPTFVGNGEVALLDESDAVVDSVTLRIDPDLALNCMDRDDQLKKVFQLELTDLRSQGWDYVFQDPTTGEEVRPGDPAHPNGGAEGDLERIVLSEVRSTGLCRIVSQAAEDLDGEYALKVESPWESDQTTSLRIIGPSSKTQWAGTQPAELTGTVTVNNVTASERTSVYQSGCS